ncbi:MAG: LPXTG cell wall anchor domain-containing protein [Lachnospiraceae bacterium]|nr:LPXTG cell wall anchor domain-containing protein [Lachnospiraceae bacterium]
MKNQNNQTNSNTGKHHGWLAAATGLLFVAICVTVAFLASILKEHVTDDADAIALVPSHAESATGHLVVKNEDYTVSNMNVNADVGVSSTVGNGVSQESSTASNIAETNEETSASSAQGGSQEIIAAQSGAAQTGIGFIEEVVNVPLNPDITVHDDVRTWETTTQVDIFKIAYENGEAVVTVDGMGDKVIAPGTGNEYTFYLKNTGNVMLDYTLEIEAFFTPDTQPIPVEARLKGYDGTYLLGAEDSWADVLELNQVKDEASISVNRFAYYTLEWQWPYESGDDAYDTLLGNLAVDEDLTLTIVIKTVATGEDMETEFIKVPTVTTGDDSNLLGWLGLAVAAMLVIGLYIIIRKKSPTTSDESEQEQAHEKD